MQNVPAGLQSPEDAAAAARRDGERALHAFRRARSSKNRRARMRNLYEAERLRCQALAHALLSPDYSEVLTELARVWEAESLAAPKPRPRQA